MQMLKTILMIIYNNYDAFLLYSTFKNAQRHFIGLQKKQTVVTRHNQTLFSVSENNKKSRSCVFTI